MDCREARRLRQPGRHNRSGNVWLQENDDVQTDAAEELIEIIQTNLISSSAASAIAGGAETPPVRDRLPVTAC